MTFENLIYNLTNDQKRTYRKIEKIENKILKNNWSIIFNKIFRIMTVIIKLTEFSQLPNKGLIIS